MFNSVVDFLLHDLCLFPKAGDIWICKPIGLNQGRGIYLVRDIDDLKLQQPDNEDKQRNTDNRTIVSNFDRIVQRYVFFNVSNLFFNLLQQSSEQCVYI